MRRTYLAASVVIFAGLLVAAWVTHDTGVKIDDPERNIFIPDELTTTLQIKASYDGEKIYFRYRWPVDRPSIFHDVLVYRDGEWVREKGGDIGPAKNFLTEDRVAMMIDDGSVPLFSRYGGYITIGDRLSTFTGAPETGGERTKYLPDTRTDPGNFDTVKPESDLATLREAGYFIDLWQWRSSRSNPIALGDDGLVAEERSGDAGRGPYSTNFNKETGQPRFMFNPTVAGTYALNFDDVVAGNYNFDDIYYLSSATALPFDPDVAWKNGDTIPRRMLRTEQGSRGDVVLPSSARWENGFWDVTLVRQMDTGNPLDDKIFKDKGSYDIALAVFRNASTMRWHYISLPMSVGLETDATLVAERFEGDTPAWEQDWTEVELFYPGQVSWPMLTDPNRHPGAEKIAERIPVSARHNPTQLAIYGVEVEFADQIIRQWLLTLIASVALIIALGININLLMIRKDT
jgi:ethylbenzene dehydrogenase